MPTPEEIEAAHLAIIEVWQTSGNLAGSWFNCGAAAKAALEAAEKVRRKASTRAKSEREQLWFMTLTTE